MREIAVFVEDAAHEMVVKALLIRLRQENAVEAKLTCASVRGGHGAVVRELKSYLRDRQRRSGLPDLVIVGTDGNCKGPNERRREITDLTERTSARVICAIPDPHIERWLMLDGAAFKQVVGAGCDAPDQKCERDRYKRLFADAIRKAGVTPILGGIEYADELVGAMDLEAVERADRSFGAFMSAVREVFREWTRTD